MMNNNLLYCFEGFPYSSRGGISQVSIRQSIYFREHSLFKSYCLCLRIEEKCESTSVFDGHIVVNVSKEYIKIIEEYIIQNDIKIVLYPIIWNFPLFKIVEKACRKTGCKIISSIHGVPNQGLELMDKYIRQHTPQNIKEWIIKLGKPLYLKYFYNRQRRQNNYIYKCSEQFVSLTEDNMNFQRDFYGMKDTSKLSFIPNPLTFNEFAEVDSLLHKKKEVLIVARFEEATKRISMALRVWSEIEKLGCSSWKLTIVGDGEDRELYYQMAEDLDLHNISFVGRKLPLYYYKRSSIFLMTSKMEGFGLTITEAMQNGVVPIVMNSFGAASIVINTNDIGFLVPDNDERRYVDNLMILMNDDELRYNMAVNTIESSKRFSIESICDQWVKLFNRVIES